MFKVLVFTMLSSASGWGLPSNDSLLSSNESTNITDAVDGANDRRQLGAGPSDYAYGCSCDWSCDRGCISCISFSHPLQSRCDKSDKGITIGCTASCDRGCDDKFGENGCDEGGGGGAG